MNHVQTLKSRVLGRRENYQVKILVRYKGKYLLLKKVKDVHPDHIGGWEVPGGKIEPHEDPIEASMREIKEETGLDCRIIKELPLLELEKNGIRTHTHIYVAEASHDKVTLSDEHSDYQWVSYDDIDHMKQVIYKDILKQYVKEAEHL
jgi:8-oxo-dGTP diphosphatase